MVEPSPSWRICFLFCGLSVFWLGFKTLMPEVRDDNFHSLLAHNCDCIDSSSWLYSALVLAYSFALCLNSKEIHWGRRIWWVNENFGESKIVLRWRIFCLVQRALKTCSLHRHWIGGGKVNCNRIINVKTFLCPSFS